MSKKQTRKPAENPSVQPPQHVRIRPPKFGVTTLRIVGIVPLVINAFSAKAREEIRKNQEAGSTARKGKQREPKDFMAAYEAAKHVSREGWCGIPAGAFRCAMISACRIVNFKMTLAKLSLFIEADGYDRVDGTPLIRIIKGEPKYVEHPVHNEKGGADIRPRPMWTEGWEANIRIRWDQDQFTAEDIVNLMARVGLQVGIGEGRPDSRNSAGMGWGLFTVEGSAEDPKEQSSTTPD